MVVVVAAVVAHLAHGAFDVRDFGAKGDGVAEDMVAVHGTIDAADVVSDTNRFSCGSGTVACLSPDSRCILSSYREVLHIRDPIGVVYPDLVEAAGQMHLLWSNSARFPNFVKWGAVQGKDQVLHAKLGL